MDKQGLKMALKIFQFVIPVCLDQTLIRHALKEFTLICCVVLQHFIFSVNRNTNHDNQRNSGYCRPSYKQRRCCASQRA